MKFEPFLTPDEKDRADRLRFCNLRRSFVVTRGSLRCLLGRYLDIHPADIRLHYGPKGKPSLASATGIGFNVTHSGDLAAFAFTRDCPIGIDLEQVHPVNEAQQIADRFFCPEEAADIMALPPSERQRAFFRCWTRKEAYIKATGDGLSTPLSQFRVALEPNEPARFIHVSHDRNAAKAWALHDLRVASNYVAALAYRDSPRSVSVFPAIDPAEFGVQ
jgi:4'-phosphopantetheinyl transferase